MRLAAITSITYLISHNSDSSAAMPASASMPVTTKPLPTQRAPMMHRAMIWASRVTILALLDLTCILWVYPIVNQLAEWLGASHTKAIHLGLGAMLLSIPLIFATTVIAFFRLLKPVAAHRTIARKG
jgi:hypothetical protein